MMDKMAVLFPILIFQFVGYVITTKVGENRPPISVNIPFAQELNRMYSPVPRALQYLEQVCDPQIGFQTKLSEEKEMKSTFPGPPEIYSSGIILPLIQDIPGLSPSIPKTLVKFLQSQRQESSQFNYYVNTTILPNDLDTTAVVTWTLLQSGYINSTLARETAEIIMKNRAENGIIQGLFPPFKNPSFEGIVDPGIVANAMRLISYFHLFSNSPKSVHYLFQWVVERADEPSTFFQPDTILHFISNSLVHSYGLRSRIGPILKEKVIARYGRSDNPLVLAMRIITTHNLGLFSVGEAGVHFESEYLRHSILGELSQLVAQQREDGSWAAQPLYYGFGNEYYAGSEAMTTAYAVKAINIFN